MAHRLGGTAGAGDALALAGAVLLAALLPSGGAAQTVEGRVVDETDERPVATALVRLVDEDGEQRAVTAADSTGRYRIVAPEPGVYRLEAERIGYEMLESPLLELVRAEGVYPLDLLVRPAPIPIAGLEVDDRGLDRQLRLVVGVSPRALRWEPVRRDALLRHVERAHDLTDLMRWGNYAGVEVFEPRSGEPCYLMRAYGCLDVYLDGFRLTPEAYDLVPLEMLQTVVVLAPKESIAYPGGAVLMYTPGWIRE